MISAPFSRRLLSALAAAGSAALVAHAVTLFLFFVNSNFEPSVLATANGFFGFSTVFAFLLLTVAIVVTELSRWYLTLAAGLLAGAIGAYLGTLAGTLLQGIELTGSVAGAVLNTLAAVNLAFIVPFVLSTLAVAPRVHSAVMSARPLKLRSGRVALVRLPSPNLADGAVTHIEREAVDTDLADTQWASYVDALRANGWSIVEVPMAEDLADSVFVEDAVIVVGDLAILTRPGAEHRSAEVEDVESTVRDLGMSVARIVEPGTLDGGDVMQVGDTVYVGVGGRTNGAAIAQLREILRPTGRTVVAVPLDGVLHLKSAVTALPDGTVIGTGEGLDTSVFPRFLTVPEAAGSHIVVIADDTLLMAASAPRSAALLESLGYRVEQVDISEFEKLEGCVTCLSVRIR
ncbi:MAG: dimethylargininase [Naasia sp.]